MNAPKDRLVELLTDRALVGLGPREQIELAELLVKEQDLDPGAFDHAASAAALAAIGPLEAMPAGLADAIEEKALAYLAEARPSTDFAKTRPAAPETRTLQAPELLALQSPETLTLHTQGPITVKAPLQHQAATMPFAVPSVPPPSMPAPQQPSMPPVSSAPYGPTYPPAAPPASAPSNVVAFPQRAPRASNLVAVSGWIAAAACLALAIGALYIRRPQPVVIMQPAPVPTPSVVDPPPQVVPETAADLRKQLLTLAGTLRAEWSTTKDPAGKAASGEVVWNKEQQRGTMTFRGLGRNDRAQTQYQLWIFDKNRDDKYPVDGGVFDIDADTGDVVVPIKAAVPVTNATLFAVTIEKAGGVVVSKREHLVLTAKM